MSRHPCPSPPSALPLWGLLSHTFQKTCLLYRPVEEGGCKLGPTCRVRHGPSQRDACVNARCDFVAALHPDPSSFRRLKEAVCLAVPVFISCAVAWGCDSPLGHAEPGRSCVAQQKGWRVAQEPCEELLSFPSPAPSPSTRLRCAERRSAYPARHTGSASLRFGLPAR